MSTTRLFSLLAVALLCLSAAGQQRNNWLTIKVTSVEGDNLQGQSITLMQTDYEVSYGSLKLDADGSCRLKVYEGNHELSIEREGFNQLQHEFFVADNADEETFVEVSLTEKTRTPFALNAATSHNPVTGQNDIHLTWNTEAPAFFDDFESYDAWSLEFGDWTGIDADKVAAAPLLGSYPNRGVPQYAQIINPLTVEPTWWYDYPILRPYEGQQYVGFTRTTTGQANDDWLISPTINVGTDNVLQFMGKAGDQYAERFMVYVTTKTDSPEAGDFTRIDADNYETADYRAWSLYSYDLSDYAGKQVKFAIRYISDYNRFGSFMLMIDNVYVGPSVQKSQGARRKEHGTRLKSPANANESFRIYLDGELAGTTDGYDYLLADVAPGQHTVGVQAVYMQTESEVSTLDVDIDASAYASVLFNVTAQSKLQAEGLALSLLSRQTAETFVLNVTDGQVRLSSLPLGEYVVNMEEGAFEAYQTTINVEGDAEYDIVLTDRVLMPYNITATSADDGSVTLSWNQELVFSDSFEDYEDFATGSFGDWLTIDQDRQPVYPIALGSATNIIRFPGSGNATNPTAIAPMVFNPWHTTPPMLPTDQAIAAPTGDKTIIFFSPQRVKADKWLISPLLDIHEAYQLSLKAKGYSSMYPESLEFCISDGSTQPGDFTTLSTASPLTSEEWSLYVVDLAEYAGRTVRLAVHYTSTDAFLAQIDDFTVGPEDGMGETIDYGNVVRYDIYIDGVKVGESTKPTFMLTGLTAGTHTVGICAVYLYSESELAEYVITAATGLDEISDAQPHQATQGIIYDLQGRMVSGRLPKGIYLGSSRKTVVR